MQVHCYDDRHRQIGRVMFAVFLVLSVALTAFAAVAQVEPGLPHDPTAEQAEQSPDAPAENGGPPPLPPEPEQVGPPPLPAYYVGIDGSPAGPFTLPEIRDMIEAGRVTQRTLVWAQGMQNWTAASEVELIAALFDPGQPRALDSSEGMPSLDTQLVAQLLEGTWQAQQALEFPGVSVLPGLAEVSFGAGGEFAAFARSNTTLEGARPAPGLHNLVGTWSAEHIEGQRYLITVDVRVETYVAAFALTEVSHIVESVELTILGGGSFIDENGGRWVRIY